jgi:hypothetical protein
VKMNGLSPMIGSVVASSDLSSHLSALTDRAPEFRERAFPLASARPRQRGGAEARMHGRHLEPHAVTLAVHVGELSAQRLSDNQIRCQMPQRSEVRCQMSDVR